MDHVVAAEGPAWLWLVGVLMLLAFGLFVGWLACFALKVGEALDKAACRETTEQELLKLRGRVAKLEMGPDTIRDAKPDALVVRRDGDTLPPAPWVELAP